MQCIVESVSDRVRYVFYCRLQLLYRSSTSQGTKSQLIFDISNLWYHVSQTRHSRSTQSMRGCNKSKRESWIGIQVAFRCFNRPLLSITIGFMDERVACNVNFVHGLPVKCV